MSGKIKSKDLSYDNSLPPFLQRLKAQPTGQGEDADRHERPTARPRRAKDPNGEDDGPTVVDEAGETVSKEEYEKLTAKPASGEDADGTVGGNVEADVKEPEPADSRALPAKGERKGDGKASTAIGSKKRKAVKVIGEDEVEDAVPVKDAEPVKSASKPKKKKAKPIKLAFDEEGDNG